MNDIVFLFRKDENNKKHEKPKGRFESCEGLTEPLRALYLHGMTHIRKLNACYEELTVNIFNYLPNNVSSSPWGF